MNLKTSLFRLVNGGIRHFTVDSTLCQKPKNHYDSLGITKHATQADIKTAYYKLSKVYHPDKNFGNADSSKKFRDISEAYEVLGNVKLRKMYDKGFLMDDASTTSTDDPLAKFYKSRDVRSKPPPPSGRTPIYDFDEWSRSHYGATFARQQEMKKRRQRYEEQREQYQNDLQHERLIIAMFVGSLLCMYLVSNQDYDRVRYVSDGLMVKTKSPDDR